MINIESISGKITCTFFLKKTKTIVVINIGVLGIVFKKFTKKICPVGKCNAGIPRLIGTAKVVSQKDKQIRKCSLKAKTNILK